MLETSWRAEALASTIAGYLESIPDHGWPLWAIGGQDKRRIASVLGQARARAAALALTLRGTPLFYAGDELGLRQVPVPSEEARDPFERQVPGYGLNRDPERAPMPWDASADAGFTTGRPWLPLPADYVQCNVEAQRADEGSHLHFYRGLIALRHAEPALTGGALDGLSADGDILGFSRIDCCRHLHVLVNTGHAQPASLPGRGRVLLSTGLDRRDEPVDRTVHLRADEGVIVGIESPGTSHPHER